MRKPIAVLGQFLLAFALLIMGPAAHAQSSEGTRFEGNYSIRARGIDNVGRFSLNVHFLGDNYAANATRRVTNGLARTFLRNSQDYNYSVRGTRVGAVLRPSAYEHSGGRRGRIVRAAFSAADVVTTGIPNAPSMGNPECTPGQSCYAATPAQRRGVIDQVSAMAAMMITPNDPCARTLPVYMDGRSRFDFVLRPNGTQRVDIAGHRGEAIRCAVTFRPIAGFSDPQEEEQLTFLFARQPNGMFVPLRLEMPTDDGLVVLQARNFTLTGPRPN